MTSSAKTLATAVFAGLAIPMGGTSGICSVGSLLALIFSSNSRTSGIVLFFLAAACVFRATFYFLASLQKKRGPGVRFIFRLPEAYDCAIFHELPRSWMVGNELDPSSSRQRQGARRVMVFHAAKQGTCYFQF
jgi:hypothetical protein